MKKMSKVLCLLVALALTTSFVLAGCGTPKSSTSADTSSSESSVSTATAEQEKLKPVDLIWYEFVDKKLKDEDKVLAELGKYLKEKINVNLKATFLNYDDYNTKMPLIVSSGQPFDVCFTTSWMLSYNEYVSKGAFAPLNDLIDQYAKETKEIIPQPLWDAMTVGGKIYGVPGYKETGHQFGYIINKDIADELSIDLSSIKKWTDIEEALKIVKEKKPGVTPLDTGNAGMFRLALPHEHVTGDWDLPGVLNVPGMEIYQVQDDKVFNQYETPEFAAFCETMNKWWKAGYVPKDGIKYADSQTFQTEIKANKVFAQTLWFAPGCIPGMEAQYGRKLEFIPMYDPIMETADLNGGAIFAISKDSKNQERAMMFLNLLYTDTKVGNLLRNGIEEVHYKLTADGQADYEATGLDQTTHPYFTGKSGWWFGTVFNQNWSTVFAKDIGQQYLDYNKTAKAGTALGFVFDSKPVHTQIAALQNNMKELGNPLMNGMVDPKDYMPKFIEKLEKNGVGELLTEIQKQLDAWKAANGK